MVWMVVFASLAIAVPSVGEARPYQASLREGGGISDGKMCVEQTNSTSDMTKGVSVQKQIRCRARMQPKQQNKAIIVR